MKKYIIVGIVAFLIIMPIAGSSNTSQINVNKEIKTMKSSTYNFTHAVLAEYATTTTCPYCPTASNQLWSIYNSDDYDFYFLTLVGDKKEVYRNIKSRIKELNITSVPDVYFDGGYIQKTGAQQSEQVYRNAIIQSGQRQVFDFDIDVSVNWEGSSKLKISITVQNNEVEEYEGHLRVYIVEPESRWNDVDNNPYHFGVLAIPIDKSLAFVKQNPRTLGETYTFTKTWVGSRAGFGDITKDNIMVIAALYDTDTDYVLEVSAAEPTTTSRTLFEFILSRPFMNLYRSLKELGIFPYLLQQI
jgi:hypothetical protein